MASRTSTLARPSGRWWTPLGREERLWVIATVVWALAMFVAMMFVWPAFGRQHANISGYRVDPVQFHDLTQAFIDENRIGEVAGIPLVAPAPGSDVYIEASRFQFQPVVQLERGQSYWLVLSSRDVQHGFSVQPVGLNLQVMPGYVTAVKVTAQQTGEMNLVGNEYCGAGHHVMVGRMIVVEGA